MSCVSFFTTPMSHTDDRAHRWGMSPTQFPYPPPLQVVTRTSILRPLTPSHPPRYLRSWAPRAHLVSVRSLRRLVPSEPPPLSPLELERFISACPAVPRPPSIHPPPHASCVVSWHVTTTAWGHRYECQVYFSVSHLFSQPKEPQKTSMMSATSLPLQQHTGCNNIYNTPNVSLTSSSSGDLSFFSGSFIPSPRTPADISLRSPADISNPGDSWSGTSGGSSALDSSAYNQLKRHCCYLESELAKERQEHAALRYVLVPCLLEFTNMM